MSIEIIKDIFKVEETKHKQEIQRLIETETYLHTNKEEIKSILWVEGRAEITNTKIIKDRLIIGGKIKFNIAYQNQEEENNIYTIDASKEYREELPLEGITEDMESHIEARIEYIQYDLQANKIDLTALLNLDITIEETKEVEVIKEIQGKEELHLLEEEVRYITSFGRETSYVNLKEEIQIESSKPAIEKIIRFAISIVELQSLVSEDRIILSAEANISMIYYGGGQINSIKESIPFNHFIDIPGIPRDSLADIKLEVVDGTYEIVEDELGELRLIDIETNIRVKAKSYDYQVTSLPVDAYSTKGKIDIRKEGVPIEENIKNISHEEDLNLEIGIDPLEILDLKEKIIIIDKFISEEGIVVEGLIDVNIFYIEDTTNKIKNFRDQFPFKSNIYADVEEGLNIDIKPTTRFTEYEINKGSLLIDNKIKYDINLSKEKTLTVIKDIEDTGEVLNTLDNPSITIYIVQNGDKIWDIAKRYSSTIEDILTSNDLDSSYHIKVGDKIIIEKNIDNEFELV